MLVVMDCEGCDAALLQPDGLRTATVIAELHDFALALSEYRPGPMRGPS
jgi:hypothetical protein